MLMRHTRPDISPDLCYGRTDCDVAASFAQEAKLALLNLPPVRRIVTSPLLRCRRLASQIGEELGLSPESDSRLVEMDFGSWEGLPWSQIPRSELEQWASDFLHARPHGGESVAQLHKRTHNAVEVLRATGTAVLAITHAGVIRCALARGLDPEAFETRVEYGTIVSLDQFSCTQSGSP